MNRTKIEYLDYTWSPMVGCSGIGCAVSKVCWARNIEKRRKKLCELCYIFVPHTHFERLEQPLMVKKSSRIGTVFCGEFYDVGFSESIRASVKLRMEKANWHTFVIFTKQPQNIDPEEPMPNNVIECVSVNSKADLWRVNELRNNSQAKVKGISFEPLYGPICPKKLDLSQIDWIIIGAQTRPEFLPSPLWVNSLIEQASEHHIPIFVKNNITWSFWPEEMKQFPKIGEVTV